MDANSIPVPVPTDLHGLMSGVVGGGAVPPALPGGSVFLPAAAGSSSSADVVTNLLQRNAMNSMTRPRVVDEHITTVYVERFGLGTGRAHWEGSRVQVNTRITGDPTIDDSNRHQGFVRNYRALQDRVHHFRM
jgi:hypothetical protein